MVPLCKTLLLLSKEVSKSGFCDCIKILNLHLTFGSVHFCNNAFSAVSFVRYIHVGEVSTKRKRALILSKILKALFTSCFKTWGVDIKQNEVE